MATTDDAMSMAQEVAKLAAEQLEARDTERNDANLQELVDAVTDWLEAARARQLREQSGLDRPKRADNGNGGDTDGRDSLIKGLEEELQKARDELKKSKSRKSDDDRSDKPKDSGNGDKGSKSTDKQPGRLRQLVKRKPKST